MRHSLIITTKNRKPYAGSRFRFSDEVNGGGAIPCRGLACCAFCRAAEDRPTNLSRFFCLVAGAGFFAGPDARSAVANPAALFSAALPRFFLKSTQFLQWNDLIAVHFVAISLSPYNHRVFEWQQVDHFAFTVRRANDLVAARQVLPGFDVLLVLVDQTAAQPSAHASYL